MIFLIASKGGHFAEQIIVESDGVFAFIEITLERAAVEGKLPVRDPHEDTPPLACAYVALRAFTRPCVGLDYCERIVEYESHGGPCFSVAAPSTCSPCCCITSSTSRHTRTAAQVGGRPAVWPSTDKSETISNCKMTAVRPPHRGSSWATSMEWMLPNGLWRQRSWSNTLKTISHLFSRKNVK